MSFEHMTNAELIRTQGMRSDLSPLERTLLLRLEELVDKGRSKAWDNMRAGEHYANLSNMTPHDFSHESDA